MHRTLTLAFAAVSLAACNRTRPDPLVAELTSPLHAVVRVHVERPDCDDGDLVGRVKCWLRTRPDGCTYLEVGPAAAAPLPRSGDGAYQCGDDDTERLTLEPTVDRRAELVADPTGERLAVRLADASFWTVYFLAEGQLLYFEPMTTDPFSWAEVPTVDSRLPQMAALAEAPLAERLRERLLLAGGEPAIISALIDGGAAMPDFDERFDQLSAAGRTQVKAGLVAALDRADGPWRFVADSARVRPADFADRLATHMPALLDARDDEEWVWSELGFARHPRRGALACDAVHAAWARSIFDDDHHVPVAPLVIIASEHVACPAMSQWAETDPCGLPLTCPGDTPADQLCTASEAAAAIDFMNTATPMLHGPPPQGALVMAALLAQGPLPAAVRRRARQGYQLQNDAGVGLAEELSRPCRRLLGHAWRSGLCKLPLSVKAFEVERCHVEIDDPHQRLIVDGRSPDEPATDPEGDLP